MRLTWLQTLADTVEDAALTQAARHWAEAPLRVALFGLLGVGKSTLLNLLAGDKRAETGLGGVTRDVVEHTVHDALVVDTPGVDRIEDALGRFEPLLPDVDRVLWVVDGTQPVTRREREVLELCLRPHTEVCVVVSRLDLVDPDEHGRVLARVASLTSPFSPVSLASLDLRRAERARAPVPRDLLAPTEAPTPRRTAPAVPVVAALAARYGDRTPLFDEAALSAHARQIWRQAVQVQREALSGLSNPPPEREERALEQALEQLSRDAVLQPYLARRSVHLPRPQLAQPATLWRTLAGGSQRQLQAALGAWAAEGDVAMSEWAAEVADPADAARIDGTVRDLLRRLTTTDDDAAAGISG